MNAHKANLINVITLIFMSGWTYLDAMTKDMSSLFPMYFAIILLAMNDGIKYNNKAQFYVALILSLVIMLILINPFLSASTNEDQMAVFRIGIMLLTSLLAIFFLAKSILSVRLSKQNKR